MTPDSIEQVLLALKFHIEKALSQKTMFDGQVYQNPGMQVFNQFGKENQQKNLNGGNMGYNPANQLVDAEVLLEKDHTIS